MMKTLYLQCNMGAAGDMLLAALLELLPDRDAFLTRLNSLGLPGVRYAAESAVRCGITGTHMAVTVHGEEEHSHDHHAHDHHHDHGHHHEHEHEHHHEHTHHHHSTLADIRHTIGHLPVSDSVKEKACAVYQRLADAESRVHGQPVEAVHFHEVGAWDAVADVVGVCMALEELKPERILASPIHVGSGNVRCAHGILPVPAPATALLLQNVPIHSGEIRGELCTPTGAALLTEFVSDFGPMPPMRVKAIGYGMGTKEFPMANCVRAHWGETDADHGEVTELSCNLDDMTAEAIGFAQEILLQAGALDVFTTAIGMKKSRLGVMLTCICRTEDAPAMAERMLRHTTTWGVREQTCRRYTLPRTVETVQTPYGSIRIKRSGGKAKAEYEDAAAAARAHGVTLAEVLKTLPL